MAVTGETEAPRSEAAKTLLDGMRQRAAIMEDFRDAAARSGRTVDEADLPQRNTKLDAKRNKDGGLA